MASKKVNPDELLTPEQVGDLLHIHPRTVLKLGRDGVLRRVKLSHKVVLFEKDAVEDLVRRRRQNGQPGRQRPLFDVGAAAMPKRF